MEIITNFKDSAICPIKNEILVDVFIELR